MFGNNNNKKPPTLWEKFKTFLNKHSSSLFLLTLGGLAFGLFLNVFFPDFLPRSGNWILETTFG
jgi:hypothetical protein